MSKDKSLFQRFKFFAGGTMLLMFVVALGLSVYIAAQGVRLYNGFNELIDHYL